MIAISWLEKIEERFPIPWDLLRNGTDNVPFESKEKCNVPGVAQIPLLLLFLSAAESCLEWMSSISKKNLAYDKSQYLNGDTNTCNSTGTRPQFPGC